MPTDKALNSMTSEVGLDAESNWTDRCSSRYRKVVAPKTERPIDWLDLTMIRLS